MFAAPLPPQLTGLKILCKNSLLLLACSLSSTAVEALVAAGLPETLEVIDLRGNPIGDDGAMALAKGMPQQLTVLCLRGTFGYAEPT